MVLFDTAVLLLLLDPGAKPPVDPSSGKPVHRAGDRINHLVNRIGESADTIVVPTPVLSEVLVHAGQATQSYLEILNGHRWFRVAPFDQKAAIEAALAMRDALRRGGHRIDASKPDVTKTKVKFDRQIVAIAKAEGVHTVYSDDDDVVRYANQAGISALRTADLDLPPENPQGELQLRPQTERTRAIDLSSGDAEEDD